MFYHTQRQKSTKRHVNHLFLELFTVCPKLGSKVSMLSHLVQEFLLTIDIDYNNSILCTYGTPSWLIHVQE
jgi:hypothetical protein